MSLAHSLYLHPSGSPHTRRLGADEEETAFAAAEMPRWARPLYLQPDRPSRKAIVTYQLSMAAERALSVPHGINLLQQTEDTLMEANEDFRHCDCCEAPIEAASCRCPYCHWEG